MSKEDDILQIALQLRADDDKLWLEKFEWIRLRPVIFSGVVGLLSRDFKLQPKEK